MQLKLIFVALVAIIVIELNSGCGEKVAQEPKINEAKYAQLNLSTRDLTKKTMLHIREVKVMDEQIKSAITQLKAEKDPSIKTRLGMIYIELVNAKAMSKTDAIRECEEAKATAGEFSVVWDTYIKKIG